ncbi:polysaccharide biosynthesis protein [Butyrivibrio proteoclasticus B316]|jgi:N-acetyl sugar amidotransferase|uniref:Polysaccharide biosynthesis protein n=1 Tax=Butyrivibrio proteoclasticus (strain ATCC 51982 / DSM 14932 / B316) TaxID=515622 RepID=E0RX84_BUTPB|nr:N-acetyl sugar amidotransferase [Butyrivibrio proteoclasticus]ADL35295.1 polysaccharide biosynthesis protein [Butyrivibrio proteoclasticus B316]
MKMRYCKRCLQPDTRPGIIFDDEQICFACRYEESKATINWEERQAELKSFAEEAKAEAKKRGNTYDCIIGVSGGKDSTFQAVYAKERLGLNPLLINCMPDEITEIGRKNIENLNNLGFDIISIRPNPIVAKKLARKSFFERGNIIAASEYCLWASAYIMAVKFNIPLIIQGENAALTLGAAKNQEATGNAFSVMQLETIRGASVDSFVDLSNNITEKDLFLYKIPTVEEMQAKGIRAIFLQYYVREWSQVTNADFAVARGLTGRSGNLHDLGRYRRYTALDCDLQIPNQMIKYLKFGFGYATDEICYDIREGRFSREDGKWYVNEYDGGCGEQYIEKTCKYLGITKEEFWEVVDKYVNRDLFEKIDGKWTPKFTVGEDYES